MNAIRIYSLLPLHVQFKDLNSDLYEFICSHMEIVEYISLPKEKVLYIIILCANNLTLYKTENKWFTVQFEQLQIGERLPIRRPKV